MNNIISVSINDAARGINGYGQEMFGFEIEVFNLPQGKFNAATDAVSHYIRKEFGVLAGITNGGSYGSFTSEDGRELVNKGTFVRVTEFTWLDKGKADHMLALFLNAGIEVDNSENAVPQLLAKSKLPQTYAELLRRITEVVNDAIAPPVKPNLFQRLSGRRKTPEL